MHSAAGDTRASRNVTWRWLALAVLAVLAVGWRGGYSADSRSAVVVLAGLALVCALWTAPEATARACREPIVLALAALAAVTALSAAWTIGAPNTALRDAAVVLALATVVVVAAAQPAPWGHAGLLLVVALSCAVSGLLATIATTAPHALPICGTWRPAGPFEYPPTLALVCVGALPAALAIAGDRRRAFAAIGVLAAWLLATTIALTANRTGIALGALAIAATAVLAPRERAVAPFCLGVLAAASASTLVLAGDLARADALHVAIAITFGVAGAALLPSLAERPRARRSRGRWSAIVAVAALLAATAGVLAEPTGCGGELSHGRLGIWRAAIDTAGERPLQGFGAGTFLTSSRSHQLTQRPVPTRYAHDLALESWVEVGLAGLLAVLAWYAAVARAVFTRRRASGAWVLIPAVAAFPLANLLDWPWELTGSGVLWAIAAGGLLACVSHDAVSPFGSIANLETMGGR